MKILIDECAIDLIPETWKNDKNIKNYISQFKRLPLRNGSKHQHLLRNIPKEKRLDRPDILHFALLTLLGYSHLIDNLEIYFQSPRGLFEVNSETRLPRDQQRFYGLIETVFQNKSNNQFIRSIDNIPNVSKSVVFSRFGNPLKLDTLNMYDTFIFGGFAYGSLLDKHKNIPTISLSSQALDLWTSLSLFLNTKSPIIS